MAKPATQQNTYDSDVVNSLLGKIDSFDADLLSERGSYMAKCRVIRDSINDVYDEARAAGVPRKELLTFVKIRKNERKNLALFNDLEADQRQNLALLAATERVRDLPLWRAAEPKPAAAERPDGDNEWDGKGFKPLH